MCKKHRKWIECNSAPLALMMVLAMAGASPSYLETMNLRLLLVMEMSRRGLA